MSYNPYPTRVWSRVQNPCTFTVNSSYNSVFLPLTGKTGTQLEANYEAKLISKGNILQYKKNSSNLTKKQKYTQICKGMWTNRTKSFATQTQTYTNPNTSNFMRVNYVNVPTNGNITYIPGPYNFYIPAPNGCNTDTIKDGGSLLCNTIVNPCTDEVIDTTVVLKCYPTTSSDVPGPVQDLCWDPKLDTWYPRQNLTMNNSTDKWPEGYKGFVSALSPNAPYLTVDSTTCNLITISWKIIFNICIPISSYNIYQDGVIIQNVSYTTTSTTISGLNIGTYSFYITALSTTIESEPSNTVFVTISPTPAPTNLTINIVNICSNAILSWTAPLPCNFIYEIYDNTLGLIGTTTSTNYPVILADCTIYSFYVVAILDSIPSAPSNIVSAEGLVTYNITSLINTSYTPYSNNGYTGIVFDNNNSTTFTTGTAVINFCKNVNNASILIVGGGGGGGAGDKDPPSPTFGVNSSGAGGGGAAVTYLTGQTISGSININLTIGFGGKGKSPGNGGFGNLTGQAGTASIFSSHTAGGGGGGRGDGSTTVGGGDGGSSLTGYGGGGGGGGASIASPTGNSTLGGPGGIGSLGNNGFPGANAVITTGGTGGVNALTSVLLPFIPVTLNLGGGGGGGGTVSGGGAGNGTGGLGGTNSGSSPGANSLYGIINSAYGGAGGGSGINTNSAQAIGGNGGNGTVIIWWPTC